MSEPGMNEASMSGAALSETGKPFIPPGMQLAAYRQERGWTVEQVASQLNLAPRQIAAIESGDYSSLPGMPIVRGFIRSYAKLLKVDAAPLLATLGGETAPVPITPSRTLAAPFAETRLPSMINRSGLLSEWSGGLLLIILLGVAIWAVQQNGDLADFYKSTTTQVKEGWASLSGPEQGQRKSDPETPLANADSASIPSVALSSKPDTPSVALPAAPVMAGEVAKEPALAPDDLASADENIVTAGKDTLVLKAREDSWIEVRRASNDRSLLLRLMKAGESESVEITEPVSLVIGNAVGVDASLRGEPLELKAGGSNVARLNLK